MTDGTTYIFWIFDEDGWHLFIECTFSVCYFIMFLFFFSLSEFAVSLLMYFFVASSITSLRF